MNNLEQEHEKRRQSINKACAEAKIQGGEALGSQCTVGLTTDMCGRPGIRERVTQQVNRAANESHRLERLLELDRLLNQNPDVARILDLIEEVRG